MMHLTIPAARFDAEVPLLGGEDEVEQGLY
jgi:hypothetical protein